jgi:acetoin utilization deacetylase AcuC-like enzyme
MSMPCFLLQARTVFCAVRPPGHHAGPSGLVPNRNDPHGSHGFCILSNIAIAAAYALNVYRHQGMEAVHLSHGSISAHSIAVSSI